MLVKKLEEKDNSNTKNAISLEYKIAEVLYNKLLSLLSSSYYKVNDNLPP